MDKVFEEFLMKKAPFVIESFSNIVCLPSVEIYQGTAGMLGQKIFPQFKVIVRVDH